ncbi:stage V sporulation protein AA [Paenibacillus sp. TRM 82003]|nr:stage V sporulation protein AA [Paenibacillus sp. TRM 82003]
MVPVIYLRLRKRARLPRGRAIKLGDIAQLLTEPELESKLRDAVLHRPDRSEGNLILIDILTVISKIKNIVPEATIETFGEPHSLVEIYAERKPANRIAFVIVWLLLFFGSGLAIMNFHEDVSMPAVHQRIVYLLTGETVEHPYLLQIPYSFGIGLGMVIFFNHVFKKKINEEPSPLDVEMFKYEESVHQYVVTEEYRKLNERKPRGRRR